LGGFVSSQSEKSSRFTYLPGPEGITAVTNAENIYYPIITGSDFKLIEEDGNLIYHEKCSPPGKIEIISGVNPTYLSCINEYYDRELNLFIDWRGRTYDPISGGSLENEEGILLGIHWPTFYNHLSDAKTQVGKGVFSLGIWPTVEHFQAGGSVVDIIPIVSGVKGAIEANNLYDRLGCISGVIGESCLVGAGGVKVSQFTSKPKEDVLVVGKQTTSYVDPFTGNVVFKGEAVAPVFPRSKPGVGTPIKSPRRKDLFVSPEELPNTVFTPKQFYKDTMRKQRFAESVNLYLSKLRPATREQIRVHSTSMEKLKKIKIAGFLFSESNFGLTPGKMTAIGPTEVAIIVRPELIGTKYKFIGNEMGTGLQLRFIDGKPIIDNMPLRDLLIFDPKQGGFVPM
jgi:hypothetical protein